MAIRRRNDVLQEFATISCESSAQALGNATGGVAATCTITCDTNANMTDGNTLTLDDGLRKVTYEYDKSANGVGAGNVSWAAGTTAATVAANLRTAIIAQQTGVTVTDNADGTLSLAHNWLGAGGNATGNAKSSASALAITAWAGGVNNTAGATSVAATTTQKFHKFTRAFRVDSVEYLNPTGFAQNASAYWTIALKNGSTSVASWSTQTAGQGTITGGTPVSLVLSATDASLVFAAGDIASLVMTKTSTPAALPPGRLVIHGHYVS